MKPIQKGLAIIAGATLITVLAISFLGEGSKNEEQAEAANADVKVEGAEAQTKNVMNAEGPAAEGEQAKVNLPAEKDGVEAESGAAPDSIAKASSEGMESSKQVANENYANSEAVSTSNTPAPPGPFHKNTLAGSTPVMPAAPAAPSSDNVDLPPPPMPQAIMDAPQSPAAPEPDISKPDFVTTRQEMGVVSQEQPAALTEVFEAPAQQIRQENTPKEMAVSSKEVESAKPEVQAEVVEAEVVEVESAKPQVQAEVVEAEAVEVESAKPEDQAEAVRVESVEVESAKPEDQAEAVRVESVKPEVQAEVVEAAVLPTMPIETLQNPAQEKAAPMNESTADSELAIPSVDSASTAEASSAEQLESNQSAQAIDNSAMQQPQLEMPERPMPPMMPPEIQQNGVNMQPHPMPMYQGQPRVIYVPVPVYPYQYPAMNQQWSGHIPQMGIIPPQPPVMGETGPMQGQ